MNRISQQEYSDIEVRGITCPRCNSSQHIFLNRKTDNLQCQVCDIEGDEDEFISNSEINHD